MNVYHKSKFTGIEIDQRLTQGTYDDAVKAGFTGTKEEFDQLTWAFGKEQQELLKTAQQQRADDLETESKNIVEAINEIKESVDSISDPYEINLNNLLSAEDSESISTAIGGIDNLNATVQDNRIIVGTISNGSVSVSIRILGNVTTLYYLLDSVVGLTLNEIAITNTSGTLSKSITTHSVLTENMVINSLESNETTLPLSAAQGKVLATDKQNKTDNNLNTEDKTVVGAINELNKGTLKNTDRVQETGGSETAVMSQKAVSKALSARAKLAYCFGGSLTIEFAEGTGTFSSSFLYYSYGENTYGSVTNVSGKTFKSSGIWYIFLNTATKELEGYNFSVVPSDLTNFYLVAVGENANTLFSTSKITPSQLGIIEKITSLQSQVDAIEPTTPDTKGKVFMSLGDSITAEGYYIGKLREILRPSKYYNLAVASATWADRSGTTSYDGNLIFGGDQNQNVLGNQVQKIIDNPETYATAPDIIIIAAGTNDSVPSASELEDSSIEAYFTTNNGSEAVPCTEPTFNSDDTYMQMRKKIPGAMRYACSKLAQLYPNARIYILTPIQGCNSLRPYTNILPKQTLITKVAKRMGLPVIHVGEEGGIYGDFEYLGSNWDSSLATESLPKNGRDLRDGLHPNDSGSKKMAKYIGREIINDYVASE